MSGLSFSVIPGMCEQHLRVSTPVEIEWYALGQRFWLFAVRSWPQSQRHGPSAAKQDCELLTIRCPIGVNRLYSWSLVRVEYLGTCDIKNVQSVSLVILFGDGVEAG